MTGKTLASQHKNPFFQVAMVYPVPVDERKEALACLIYFYGGRVKPFETYAPLAAFFRLTRDEREQSTSDGKRCQWHIDVQNAREKLVQAGYLERTPQRGWRLTAEGEDYAKSVEFKYKELRRKV